MCDKFVTKVRSDPVRALVVTNMWPSDAAPQRGVFVRDQVEALRRMPGVDVEVFAFPPGPRALLRAMATIRRRTRGAPFDVVHAHFGLAALPALAARRGPVVVTLHGNDLFVRRSRARHPRGAALLRRSRRPSRARSAATCPARARGVASPCCRSASTWAASARSPARRRASGSASTPPGRTSCSRTTPRGPLKRFDRAQEAAGDVPLLTLGAVHPDEVPYWINAANAVLVPSQDEGFGLSVIEALACGVPAFGTPVGIHPVALHGVAGAYCAEWDPAAWRAALAPVVAAADPRVDGRDRAAMFSADRMAERVVEAWRAVAAERGGPGRGARTPAYTRRFGASGDRAPDRP